ncbi:glycosyltransferase family 25 protein [Mesorhizobium sp. WSM4898]|uniref:glycosyltransferase family 25 protein n=1 Tax=Mesorhizobium sp. WSM4898 TaxID=3038544 RepID=UPI00241584A4|nr:glycosyltransferase family 25 protein [Mesorhizobium sp. WSM4898]MDG4909836.1 glycosyltransferase family 25 protein [Mesorhizobium sp. WSM4898]
MKEFSRRGVPVNWFVDHDVPDLSESDRQSRLKPAEISLARKHIGIWDDFLMTEKPFCLVFEDDVFLSPNFVARLNDCIRELTVERQAVVYLGNGGNYYTSWLILRRGRSLYPAKHSRCTDSYVLTRSAAEARLRWFRENEFTKPSDLAVNNCDRETNTEILWFERPIVEQGSQNGRFKTSISTNRGRPLWYKRLEWRWKKFRRQFSGHRVDG